MPARNLRLIFSVCFGLAGWLGLTWGVLAAVSATPNPTASNPARTNQPIPWSELEAKATAQYSGDDLAVSATGGGARLRCVFQRLEGKVTAEGLWLVSTVRNAANERFRVKASAVGRVTPSVPFENLTTNCGVHGVPRPTTQLANTGSV